MEVKILEKETVEKIYNTDIQADFPPEEIKPLSKILKLMNEGVYTCFGLYDNTELLSYAFTVSPKESDFMLLDYFAVLRGRRSGGIGGIFFEKLKETAKDKNGILIEVDDPDFAEDTAEKEKCQRRIMFYTRHGALNSGLKTLLFDANYQIYYLSLSGKKETNQIKDSLETVYKRMMTPESFNKHFSYVKTK